MIDLLDFEQESKEQDYNLKCDSKIVIVKLDNKTNWAQFIKSTNNGSKVMQFFNTKKNKTQFRRLCRMNLQQQPNQVRLHCWKILLGSIPFPKQQWYEAMLKNKLNYEQNISNMIVDEDLLGIQNKNIDQKLWEQIQLDTKRTHTSFIIPGEKQPFFRKQNKAVRPVYNNKPTHNYDVLTRILYVWAKLNPSIRYIQGMNQILSPIFYLSFKNPQPSYLPQSQTFHLFCCLISDSIDLFIQQMDNSNMGINGRLAQLDRVFMVIDYQLWLKINREKIGISSYCFRWIMLMMGQQFSLDRLLKLWDVLISFQSIHRFKYLYFLCIAVLQIRRKSIINEDFSVFLPKIQRIKDMNIEHMIAVANRLFTNYRYMDFKKQAVQLDDIYKTGKVITKSRAYQLLQMFKSVNQQLQKFRQ